MDRQLQQQQQEIEQQRQQIEQIWHQQETENLVGAKAVTGKPRQRDSLLLVAAAGAAVAGCHLVADQLAAATGENRRTIDQARTLLLACWRRVI
jgi:hypothetical protein